MSSSVSQRTGSDRCDECSHTTAGEGVIVGDFGLFHRECLQTCMCGRLWPWSLVSSGDVVLHCVRCARMDGGFYDAA